MCEIDIENMEVKRTSFIKKLTAEVDLYGLSDVSGRCPP